MSRTILKSSWARRDLVEIADYLHQAAGLVTAERFLDAVDQALGHLAVMPGMGSLWEPTHPRLQGIRTWVVPGFRNFVIYYRPLADGIDLLRLLHGSREGAVLLDITSDEP